MGRNAERELLGSALTDARDGRGSLFLVVGEAGIGKTRLAEAIAETAAGDGDTVLWGSAWQAGGAPAYWPWAQVLRELIHDRPPGEIVEDLGAGAGYVAQIAPELSRRVPIDTAPAPSIETAAARFSAFDATASFIHAAAARRPIVIVLDDLQAADVPTVRLLEFLARSLHGARILALATLRAGERPTDPDITAALEDLAQASQRIFLRGLARDEVHELAGQQASRDVAPELVDRLHALSEGNPLFVAELLRLLAAEGAPAPSGAVLAGRLPVPEAVRGLVSRRLVPLEPPVVELLTVASVIGPEFRLGTLARVIAENRAALVSQLDAAAEVGLVEELPGTPGRYRFCHALIRETLYDKLTAQGRSDWHEKVGEALVEAYGSRPDAPLSVLAHHFLEAAPAGNAVRAADYAARAGERALDAMAYEHAIDLLRSALGALDLEPCEHDRRGPILLAMGRAEMRAGRLVAGRETLRMAAAEARRLDDMDLLAQAALASAPWGLATAASDEEDLIPLLTEARAGLPASDGELRARVLARLAAALYWTESVEQREQLAAEAIAMAERVGDPATRAWVLCDAHLATWRADTAVPALRRAAEIKTLGEQAGNIEIAMVAHSWSISLRLELGELVDELEIEMFARTASRLHQHRAQAQALLHRSARALIVGRYEEAEQLLGQAAEYAGMLQEDAFLGMRLGALAFVMREAQGRLGELEYPIREFVQAHPMMPVWRCGLLCVLLQSGREAELRREYDRLAESEFSEIKDDNLRLPALALLTEACAHLGDRVGAATLREKLAPYAGRNVVTPDVAFIGPVDRYLALAAATQGDHEPATAWFASARERAGEMHAGPTCARLLLDEARVLRERDPTRAAMLAADAAARAEELGLDWLAGHARSLLEVLDATPVEAPLAAPPAAERRGGHLVRRGAVWEVGGSGSAFFLRDAKGLHHLARLLAAPGTEFHALELAAPGTAVRGHVQGDAGPLLDPQAKREYRQRITNLEAEIEEAEAFHDPERSSRARAELDFVAHELTAAVGLGGRDRRARADSERARVNVTRAVHAVVERIADQDERLGHHLRTCVRTGTFCAYEPGPDVQAWEIDSGA